MGPQKCGGPCGVDKVTGELENAPLREKWSADEGVKWEWRASECQTTSCAWWRLCVPCHRLAWPLDRRNRNGSSCPWERMCEARARDRRKGVLRRDVGDFWVTSAPPEWVATLGSATPTLQPQSNAAEAQVQPAVMPEGPVAEGEVVLAQPPAEHRDVRIRPCLKSGPRTNAYRTPAFPAGPVERQPVSEVDRQCVVLGSGECDRCGALWTKPRLRPNLAVTLLDRPAWEVHSAFLCAECISPLWRGESCRLQTFEGQGRCAFKPSQPTRVERLQQLELPYYGTKEEQQQQKRKRPC
jgi:hypothetical protein